MGTRPKRASSAFRSFLVLACVLPAGAGAAPTYHFDWFCSGCAAVGMGSNGSEGPFGSGPACEGARATMRGSLDARGCGPGCFNPQPCVSAGRPEAPASPAPLAPAPEANPASPAPTYDTSADRARRADDLAHREKAGAPRPPSVAGEWRNAFSRYEARSSKGAIEFVLAETCRAPDCARRDAPNRPVFRGRLIGRRLVGVVPIHGEPHPGERQCATQAGEFRIEGVLSEDGSTIVWGHSDLPLREGCPAMSISLGIWRRA